MQPFSHRLADYRLAIYVVAAALLAGGATFAFDRLTAPSVKLSANSAPASSGAVRQIPISRTSAADIGDPDGKLTPVYPTSPGKDLPVKEAPVRSASTTGSGAQTATPQLQTAPAPAAQNPVTAQAPNSCNVAVCAAAYRSFRESDCTYQPFGGPRRFCDGAPDANAPNTQASVQPQDQPALRPRYDTDVRRSRYDNELRDAERAVRRLPPPGVRDEDEDSGITVIEQPARRYELRRNWIAGPEE
jgi:hypothetical protein